MGASSITNQNALQCIVARYDFAVHGGAVSSIGMRVRIPSGSIICNTLLDVITAPTSGGSATIAVTSEGAGDIVAATSIASAPWSTTGRKVGIPDFATATDAVKTTAERELTVTIATAALTAGKFDVYIFYVNNATA